MNSTAGRVIHLFHDDDDDDDDRLTAFDPGQPG